jgi:hypothetical protein
MVNLEVLTVQAGNVQTVELTVENGVWQSPSEDVIQRAKLLYLEPDYYPDRDKALAMLAVKRLGARITKMPPVLRSTGNIDEGPDQPGTATDSVADDLKSLPNNQHRRHVNVDAEDEGHQD